MMQGQTDINCSKVLTLLLIRSCR